MSEIPELDIRVLTHHARSVGFKSSEEVPEDRVKDNLAREMDLHNARGWRKLPESMIHFDRHVEEFVEVVDDGCNCDCCPPVVKVTFEFYYKLTVDTWREPVISQAPYSFHA